MEPILKAHFNNFKKKFEIDAIPTSSDKDGAAFEKFVNYVLFSMDYPEIFTADAELLDFVGVGGSNDTGIDGIGIKVNDRLVRNTDEVTEIALASKKINVEFFFIQSKMKNKFEKTELNTFGTGVKVFFSDPALPENARIREFREIKDFIYSDEAVVRKLDKNPSLFLYYVSTGSEPTEDNFLGNQKFLTQELEKIQYFESVEVKVVGGKQLIKFCRELENKFDVQMNVIDIFPLSVDTVDNETDVKKAYAFTCNALEFLKVLTKEDGSLRRSLFNDNVRDYLGDSKNVNGEIEKTITENPEMFLLCNNGITIVCTDFEQVRDKLVKIENPQIVNGCQTSNSLFNQRDTLNIHKVKLLVRLISTENPGISNQIVRGTNKQNQVLEEAFETTRGFHQDTLEPFFLAFENNVKIYYERRAKQYNEDPLIKKTQIVNLRILTQTFVSIFLDSPHDGHRHESILLKDYAEPRDSRKIFIEEHSPYPYYICALIWYMFEKYFQEERINRDYKKYKAHLYLIFRMSVGEFPPKLTKSKQIEDYCSKLLHILKEEQFAERLERVLSVFDATQRLWIGKGKSRDSIKDRKGFTDLMLEQARENFISREYLTKGKALQDEKDDKVIYEGIVLNIIPKNDFWFGFIKNVNRYEDEDNVYFDNRGYGGDVKDLSPNTPVRFERGTNPKGYFGINVQRIN
ncbi:AIPR family protein [Microcoleus sp. bin38.metabat.b11b12b14.051]|uniref:AIPR family protein n=1 Tax=Microcoleus sp. bin38.metabat.b11b12b14.051 TaxID=2742709 RepID=UPI0025D32406|nr:AIPR family protein [Microcoleus sp. bin38.metabat.b11b12b14.051]